jgi:C_GCAxxG_C_C family probable redox protein
MPAVYAIIDTSKAGGVIVLTPREQKAHDYFYGGYNCAQSVFAAFHEEMGISEELALKLMMPMGGGVGGLREVCGAFTGAVMALNLIHGDFDPADAQRKKRAYERVQAMAAAFKAQYGTCICRELLELNDITPLPVPAERSGAYYEARPCGRYVEACAKLAEETPGI